MAQILIGDDFWKLRDEETGAVRMLENGQSAAFRQIQFSDDLAEGINYG